MTNLKNFIKCFTDILDNNTCEDIINTYDPKKFNRSLVGNDYEISDARKVYENFLDPKFENIIFENHPSSINSIAVNLPARAASIKAGLNGAGFPCNIEKQTAAINMPAIPNFVKLPKSES